MHVPVRIESSRTNVAEDDGGGMYLRRLGHARVFQSLHISSILASELAAHLYIGNLSECQYQMCCDLLMK